MIFRLIYMNGPRKGERVTVSREPMTVGRRADCDVTLDADPEVASRHCTLTHTENDELHIHDEGSMNRILVNSHELTDGKLKHGDIIEVGRTRFLVQAFVQAEVNRNSHGTAKEKKSPWLTIVLLALIAAVAIALIQEWRGKRETQDTRNAKNEVIPPTIFKDLTATGNVDTSTTTQTTSTPVVPTTTSTIAPKQPAAVTNTIAVTHPPEEVPPPIVITSLSQQKFPQKDEYDEMRVATLELRTTGSVLDDSKVAVHFMFYDRDLSTGEITPARAIVPVQALHTTSLGTQGSETITASYTVPKGLRTARAAESGRAFYGVHVKVMYNGELVAEKAVPKTLLEQD